MASLRQADVTGPMSRTGVGRRTVTLLLLGFPINRVRVH